MRLAPLVLLLAAVLAAAAPMALADGDPASDLLLSQPAFLSPYDGHISKAEGNKLTSMLESAKQQGFPLKVAVIVTRYDLGAVPILFNRPQLYAKFLAQEDFYYWKDALLVVMPKGYGIYKAKGLPAADKAVVAGLPMPATTDGNGLTRAAQDAVAALAARRGIRLAVSSGSSGGTSVWVERGQIAGGVVVLCALALGGRWLWRRRSRPA